MANTTIKFDADTSRLEQALAKFKGSQGRIGSFVERVGSSSNRSRFTQGALKEASAWGKAESDINKALQKQDKLLDAIEKKHKKISAEYQKIKASRWDTGYIPGTYEAAWLKMKQEHGRLGAIKGRLNNIGREYRDIRGQGSSSLNDLTSAMTGGSASAMGSALASVMPVIMRASIQAIKQGFKDSGVQMQGSLDYALLSGGTAAGKGGALSGAFGTSGFDSKLQNLNSLGFSRKDLINSMTTLSSTGSYARNPSEVTGEAASALRFSKMGASIDQYAGLKGAAIRGGKDTGEAQLTRIMSSAVAQGFSGVRTGEFMDAIKSVVDATQQTASNTDVDKMTTTMESLAASGNPMLMGQRGAAVAQQLGAGMTNPGGGIAGKMFMLRAMGFGRGSNYYQAQFRAEEGPTPQNVQSVLAEAHRMGMDYESTNLALQSVFNIPLHAAAALTGGLTSFAFNPVSKLEKKKGMKLSEPQSRTRRKALLVGQERARLGRTGMPGSAEENLAVTGGSTAEEFINAKLAQGGDVAAAQASANALLIGIKDELSGIATLIKQAALNITGIDLNGTPNEQSWSSIGFKDVGIILDMLGKLGKKS